MEPNELSEEQKAKARACATAEELAELAKSEGIDLSEEQMRAISGGGYSEWISCSSDDCALNTAT